MKNFFDIPKPIIWNIFSIFTIGMACLAVGVAVYAVSGDRTMLTLKLSAIAGFSVQGMQRYIYGYVPEIQCNFRHLYNGQAAVIQKEK